MRSPGLEARSAAPARGEFAHHQHHARAMARNGSRRACGRAGHRQRAPARSRTTRSPPRRVSGRRRSSRRPGASSRSASSGARAAREHRRIEHREAGADAAPRPAPAARRAPLRARSAARRDARLIDRPRRASAGDRAVAAQPGALESRIAVARVGEAGLAFGRQHCGEPRPRHAEQRPHQSACPAIRAPPTSRRDRRDRCRRGAGSDGSRPDPPDGARSAGAECRARGTTRASIR